jgi:hypothetical protein
MTICNLCGQPIEFRTIDGEPRPFHPPGGCTGRMESAAVERTNPSPVYIPCPKCGDRTWFLRHNGGSFWVDTLGPPWPKHPCFDGAGFVGKRPFSVGPQTWHNCDFCAAIVPRQSYAAHVLEHATVRDQILFEKYRKRRTDSPPKRRAPGPIDGKNPILNLGTASSENENPSATPAPTHRNSAFAAGPTFVRQKCECGRDPTCRICNGQGSFIRHRFGLYRRIP